MTIMALRVAPFRHVNADFPLLRFAGDPDIRVMFFPKKVSDGFRLPLEEKHSVLIPAWWRLPPAGQMPVRDEALRGEAPSSGFPHKWDTTDLPAIFPANIPYTFPRPVSAVPEITSNGECPHGHVGRSDGTAENGYLCNKVFNDKKDRKRAYPQRGFWKKQHFLQIKNNTTRLAFAVQGVDVLKLKRLRWGEVRRGNTGWWTEDWMGPRSSGPVEAPGKNLPASTSPHPGVP
ncbi:hypothetical protein CSUI_005360 [Cystoisospora suis]|uniref:Uncharacterized protein n=1 Tax=Cystoisospora suis TaxID=483139 RepID=A0A2C6KXD7_9APIC|nr:hypothetical protein CSUI_005360 [Cystoisospora suis]